jgi:hypothetical protein
LDEPSGKRHLGAGRRRGEAIRLELPRLSIDIDDEARLELWQPSPQPLR